MSVFFFQHSLHGDGKIPGRFPFSVRAAAMRQSSETFVREPEAERVVYADGLGPNVPGPNVDPNVFSDLLPWFLTFCLVGGKDEHRVRELATGGHLQGPLSRVADRGDVVIFGSWVTTKIISVDTVLCVDACVRVPTEVSTKRRNAFDFESGFGEYRRRVAQHVPSFGRVTWDEFTASDDFTLNVADALPEDSVERILGVRRKTHHKTPMGGWNRLERAAWLVPAGCLARGYAA